MSAPNATPASLPQPPLYLAAAWIRNRAPLGDLNLVFSPAEVAILSALNGRGKTTVLSYIADAFYEMAKPHFSDVTPDTSQFYRIASGLDRISPQAPSLVYLRFKAAEETFDYVDLRQPCLKEQYLALVSTIPSPIDYDLLLSSLATNTVAKQVSPNWTKEKAQQFFGKGVYTFFPAYRFEVPEYLNAPFQTKLTFRKDATFTGKLAKPIESATSFPQIANWLMDVILDRVMNPSSVPAQQLFASINQIVTMALSARSAGPLRLGVGPRHFGPTRIQVVKEFTQPPIQIYPSVFRLSSGEQALLTLFTEILRRADQATADIALSEIEGIVLIDEIDKHLHIKLQKEILPQLLKLFPKIQFIASSHSPFLGMGLADTLPARGRIIDLSSGLALPPTNDPQYQEVYELMLGEEARFRELYINLQNQFDNTKKIQIITEGFNTEHIRKALHILCPELLENVHIVAGIEAKSGSRQLKNAFEIMSRGEYSGHFIFVWDCDAQKEVDSISETPQFNKYCFPRNTSNTKTKRGIENLYPDELFGADVFDEKTVFLEFSGEQALPSFSKDKFLKKVLSLSDKSHFSNFEELVVKLKQIISATSAESA
jgi:hypothetical protein